MNGPNTRNKPTAYVPLPRRNSQGWVDSSGNFWLYGGYGYSSSRLDNDAKNSAQGYLSDLWMFNPNTNQWKGINTYSYLNRPGSYGTRGIPSIYNQPGARSNSMAWIDSYDDLWLFGGEGYASSKYSYSNAGTLSDVWKYNSKTKEWTWVSGLDNYYEFASHGIKGVSSIENTIGARRYSHIQKDFFNNIWIFGGIGYGEDGYIGERNDLWKITGNSMQPQP